MGHINSLTLYNSMIISSFISIFVLCFYLFLSTLSTWVIALFLFVCLSYLCWLICVTTWPFFSGWASRVYYSDNGSTAIEIALKMAFRKFCLDHGITAGSENSTRNERNIQLKVCDCHTKHPFLPYLAIDWTTKQFTAREWFFCLFFKTFNLSWSP